jgi:HEAT repeat protein
MKTHFFNLVLLIAFVTSSACSVHAAEEKELIAILQSSAGAVEKCAACQQLRIYGTAESVPALAALLGQERVGHAARYALQGIPSIEATAALREALTKTSGLAKAG